MRDLGTASSFEERLLTFEVGGDVYGLPIACVVEVSEVEPLACIPTLPASVGGVINHHGDALPVLHRTVLLGVAASTLRAPTHVVVMTARPSGGLRFGMPVDRIAGLVDGAAAVARGNPAWPGRDAVLAYAAAADARIEDAIANADVVRDDHPLLRHAQAVLQERGANTPSPAPAVPPELRGQLRALGYVDGD